MKSQPFPKGRLWHRLFGHEPLTLAGNNTKELFFWCPCGGFVRVRVAAQTAWRLMNWGDGK